MKAVEGRARRSGSGQLLLSVGALNLASIGFYDKGCGYDFLKDYEEKDADGLTWKSLVYMKDCIPTEEEVQQEEETQAQMAQAQYDADRDLDESEDHEELAPDLQVGDVKTALNVWLTSIRFWTRMSKPIAGEHGDYDRDALEKYADEGQAAGKAWALAIQLHSGNKCNWCAPSPLPAVPLFRPPPPAQRAARAAAPRRRPTARPPLHARQYVHDTFAHFKEDVMRHGHPLTYDDSILECGNRIAKTGKRIIFWGGSMELGPDGKKVKYSQQRDTGKLDEEGNPIFKTVYVTPGDSVEAQLLENTYLKQSFKRLRGGGGAPDTNEMKKFKSKNFNTACEANEASLARLEDMLKPNL